MTTFSATGGNQTYLVPANGTLTITAKGGDGGDGSSFKGGSAATVSAIFAVQKDDVLTIVAGKSGGSSSGGSSFVQTAGVFAGTSTSATPGTDGGATGMDGSVVLNFVATPVVNNSCGPNGQNVTICYYGVTQCVSEKIAQRYAKLGATIGGCGSSSARIGTEEAAERPLTLSLEAYPNPVQDAVTVKILAPKAGPASFEVLDLMGRARQSRQQDLREGLNQVEFRLGTLPSGVYLIRAVDATNRQAAVRVSKQ